MFSLHNDGPASQLYILQPGYDPLMEYYARGASALANGRTRFRPDRDVRRDRADSRMARCDRSDQRPAPCGTGARGDRMPKALAHPRRPARAGTLRRVPLALPAGGPVGCPVLRHASRSDRVLDGDGRLETRDGPRLENGMPKDGISPAEGANTYSPKVSRSVCDSPMTKEIAMAEVKEAPKPKTENGPGQTTDIEPRTSAAPMTSDVHPFPFMRRFAREMDRLFEEFGLESAAGLHLPRLPQPRPRAAPTRGRGHPRRVVAAGRRPGARGTVRGPRRPAGAEQGRHQGGGQ